MDFFLNVPVHTSQQGLMDLMLKTGRMVASDTKLDHHFHHFALAEGEDAGLGQEIDLLVSHKRGGASFQWGALMFLPGDAMEVMKGGSDVAFKGYFQAGATF